ncbi:MAG: hypothetical protein AAF449_04645 [Myxococcota bacterium]
MGAWLQAYEGLDEAQKDRVQKWLHLNKFITRTLRIDWDQWVEDFLQPAMDNPLDYSFMMDCVPNLQDFQGLNTAGQGVTFSKDVDPATAQTARVPLRASNNLGRLSVGTQDAIARLLETGGDPVTLPPGDVAHLQKIFRREKALGRLPRKDFRKVEVGREDNEIVVRVVEGEPLMRLSVLEFGTEMRRTLA